MNKSIVEIDGLSKQFVKGGAYALEDISFRVEEGKILGLVGPDGSGKTTLLRLIAGLLKPTKGSIKVQGYDSVHEAEKIHDQIGYMPQKFGLYEDLTVIQNMKLYADLKGVEKSLMQDIFDHLLTFSGLKEFQHRLAGNLSGGMKQKLSLAVALMKKPKLLILDEPSVGVDPISRRELWAIVENLLKEKISVLWSTAYLDEAEKCNSIILLNLGHLLYQGSPDNLKDRVKDRVFYLDVPKKEKKCTQLKLLKDPHIVDVEIQGSGLRVVAKDRLWKGNGEAINIEPRFEDGFIDLLKGSQKINVLDLSFNKMDESAHMRVQALGLTKKFGSFIATDNISFNVGKGEIFGLLGPNGAGKTTTFKMMCGLLKPTSGSAFVNGFDLQKASSLARASIGYMAQKFSLYSNLSAQQNLEFFAGIYGLNRQQKKEMIQKMVELFELKPYLNEVADQLPLGFKQRLALSCAIMHEPHILFLDEPTSGVDPLTRREFWLHIHSLVEKGVSIVVTTHFMEEAEHCDRLGLVFKSKLIYLGTPDALKEKTKASSIEEAFIRSIENYEKN